jgi:hypothetical protein
LQVFLVVPEVELEPTLPGENRINRPALVLGARR